MAPCEAEGSNRWDSQQWANLQHALLRGPPKVHQIVTPTNSGLPRETQDAPLVLEGNAQEKHGRLFVSCHDAHRSSNLADSTVHSVLPSKDNLVRLLPPPSHGPAPGHRPLQDSRQSGWNASEPERLAIPVMDRPEDTQPMDTQVWEVLGYSRAGDNSYRTGDTGHVELVQFEHRPAEKASLSKSQQEDGSEDDPPTVTQLHQPETVTSPAAFSPTTPGVFARNIHTLSHDLQSSISRTPAPDLAGMFQNAGKVMGLSQLFAQTQARSSPGPADVPSDDILERPSPTFRHPERALSDSPVAVRSLPGRQTRVNLATSTAGPQEPRDHYVSLKESQELRARRMERQHHTSSPDHETTDDLRRDPERLRADKRRRDAARSERVRQEMRNIATPITGSASVRKRRKLGTAATVIGGIITPASRRKVYVDLMSDLPAGLADAPASSDEENDYFDELGQHIVSSRSSKTRTKIPNTVKKPLPHASLESTTSSRLSQHISTEAQLHSEAGRQVIATQLDKEDSSARSPAHASQAEKIADSQPTRENESHPSGIDVLPSSPESLGQSPLSDVPSSSKITRRNKPGTEGVLTSSAPSGPPKNPSSEDDVHSATGSQGSSQPTDVPSSPPPAVPISSYDGQVQAGDSSNKDPILTKSTSKVPREHAVGLPPHSAILDHSSEPLPNFRVSNRLSYAVPDTSPSVPAPTSHDRSDASASMPVYDRTRLISHPDLPLSQGHSTEANFLTARELQPPSAGDNLSRSSSALSNARGSQATNIRSMGDFEIDGKPKDVTADLGPELDVMDEDDMAFHVAMRTPEKRRGRSVYRAKKGLMLQPANTGNTADESQKIPGNALPDFAAETVSQQSNTGDDVFEASSPVTKPKKRKAVGSLKRIKGSKAKLDMPNEQLDKGSANLNTDVVAEVVPSEARTSQDAGTGTGVAAVEESAEVEPLAWNGGIEKPVCIAPHRVYTASKGEFDFNYPGTCIGQVSSRGRTSYQIKLDNSGEVITKDSEAVRRLELRVGDMVKVSIPNIATLTWVVRGFDGFVALDNLDKTSLVPHTDVYGHTKVILDAIRRPRAKTKAKVAERMRSETVPINLTYITHDQWRQFDDRLYHFAALDQARSGSNPPTPSIASLPPSPSSRKRRQTIVTAEKAPLGTSGLVVSTVAPLSQKSTGVFSNMAFAISASREADKASTMRLILDHGGTILSSGFDELFATPAASESITASEHPPASKLAYSDNLRLTPSAANLGFVALIADKHSRRAKYIQALALNIPCLHSRWISDCATSNTVLSWQQYLLPAGESSYLNDAVRSRIMPPMPSATECRLVDTIALRPGLLNDTNVILIMGKGKAEERRRTHLFLTHVLGARAVLRVHDIEGARAALQDEKQSWDWVYVEEANKEAAKADLQSTSAAPAGRGKSQGKQSSERRRSERKSAGNEQAAETKTHAPVKVVGDEFVIQSLILGALMPGES